MPKVVDCDPLGQSTKPVGLAILRQLERLGRPLSLHDLSALCMWEIRPEVSAGRYFLAVERRQIKATEVIMERVELGAKSLIGEKIAGLIDDNYPSP